MSDWIGVAKAGGLAPGEWRSVDADGTQIAVFNIGGEYFAIEDVCTHDGGRLTGGFVINDEVVCVRHGARFCVKTGEATCPPAYEPAAKFPVRVENGEIQTRDDRWD